jgi:hypothetical protein
MLFCRENDPDEVVIDGIRHYKHCFGNEMVPNYWYYSKEKDEFRWWKMAILPIILVSVTIFCYVKF